MRQLTTTDSDPTDQQSGLFYWSFEMTKEEALDLLMLLSAVESWAFSTKERMPDYLFEKIDSATDVLRGKVLGAKNDS